MLATTGAALVGAPLSGLLARRRRPLRRTRARLRRSRGGVAQNLLSPGVAISLVGPRLHRAFAPPRRHDPRAGRSLPALPIARDKVSDDPRCPCSPCRTGRARPDGRVHDLRPRSRSLRADLVPSPRSTARPPNSLEESPFLECQACAVIGFEPVLAIPTSNLSGYTLLVCISSAPRSCPTRSDAQPGLGLSDASAKPVIPRDRPLRHRPPPLPRGIPGYRAPRRGARYVHTASVGRRQCATT